MSKRPTDWLLGFAGGLLLALMTSGNSLMAKQTTPVFASWLAHGTGAVVALLLVALGTRAIRSSGGAEQREGTKRSLWVYLGGIPGAFAVVLATITVNSSLALSGSIALMLLGQVVFGMLSDSFGLFGTVKRAVNQMDFLVALCVLTGSALIIFGRG